MTNQAAATARLDRALALYITATDAELPEAARALRDAQADLASITAADIIA